jgi:hypothetical protein
VNSHSELAHLLLADMRRTRQLYFELQRDCELRTLEEATNVRTITEVMLHKNFVLCTSNDVVKEFVQSMHYDVFRKSDDDDSDVLALVCRKGDAPPSDRPFNFSRVRRIQKIGERLLCSCASTIVHCRPCRHVIAFNRGVMERTDFSDFHTKQYHAHPHTIAPFCGVGNYRLDDLSLLPPLPPDADAAPHAFDDGDNYSNDVNASAKKKRKVKGYHSCAEEFKRVLVKWGNVSRVHNHLHR